MGRIYDESLGMQLTEALTFEIQSEELPYNYMVLEGNNEYVIVGNIEPGRPHKLTGCIGYVILQAMHMHKEAGEYVALQCEPVTITAREWQERDLDAGLLLNRGTDQRAQWVPAKVRWPWDPSTGKIISKDGPSNLS